MKNSILFDREIKNIKDPDLRDFTRYYFDNCVGAWFWKSGASSSGKYHPKFAQGNGGLVRHTRAVAMILEELLQLNPYAHMAEQYKDYARVAALLHDTCKYGIYNQEDKECYNIHGELAAGTISWAWDEFFDDGNGAPEFLLSAVRCHMGQWTENKENLPFTDIDKVVHLADYFASRSFIDIPDLCVE